MNQMACTNDDHDVNRGDEHAHTHEDFPTEQVANCLTGKEHEQRDYGKAGLRFSIFFGGHVSRLDECGVTCDGPAHNEGVHLSGPLVAIDSFGVCEEACHVVIEHDSVTAQDLAAPRN